MRSICVLVAVPLALAAQTAPTPGGVADFEQNIRPLLAANCYGCHSAKLEKPIGGLLLDSAAGIARGGKSGVPAVIPGKPEESLLMHAVRGTGKDVRMPPDSTPRDIEHLTACVKMGAPDPRTSAAPLPAIASAYDWDKAREHLEALFPESRHVFETSLARFTPDKTIWGFGP